MSPPRATRLRPSPGRLLLGAALVCAAFALAAVWGALRTPWLGLELAADQAALPEGAPAAPPRVRIRRARGPAAALAGADELVALRRPGGDGALAIEPADLVEEPDLFDTYGEMESFFARQSALRRLLDAPELELVARDASGAERVAVVRPAARPLGSLPFVFWFQILAGLAGFSLSTWILVLRPGDRGARLFGLLGASYPGFTIPAAVYGTRELALDGGVFRALDSVNHLGANAFGVALVALFLAFPKPLVRPRVAWLLPAVFLPWWALDALHLAPDQNLGSRLPILIEMVGAIVLGLVQIRATRGDPRARAALRWVGVSVLLGSGLFVFTTAGASVLGWFPPLPQGYSFGFFLLMHAGVAVGLRRHKLFELDEWAWGVLVGVLGALALFALDATLVAALDWSRGTSAAVSLLACGFLWLPLRAALWRRAVGRGRVEPHELFDGVLRVSFAADPGARAAEWSALLQRVFEPLRLGPADAPAADAAGGEGGALPASTAPVGEPRIEREGLALALPRVGGLAPLRLELPWRGRGLFLPRHLLLAKRLVALLGDVESRREAFERGVRQERARIARDLHDDVGARLLSGLYGDDLDATRSTVRVALGEMRAIVQELTGDDVALDEALAELRHETVQRLEAAGLEVTWPVELPPAAPSAPAPRLDHRVYRHLASMLREVTSNVLRHAGARAVHVVAREEAGAVVLRVEDDGRGFDAAPGDAGETVGRGNGLANLRARARDAGGGVAFTREAGRTCVEIRLPFGGGQARLDGPPR